MNALDPRITPARPDLAAKHLEGKVEADRFVEGELREVVAPQAPVRREPRPDAMLDTEALKGERVMVYETHRGRLVLGPAAGDGYVGWLPIGRFAASRAPTPPTRSRRCARSCFPGRSIKLPPIESLSLGCRLPIARIEPAVRGDGGQRLRAAAASR